jgi:hypothetical protein
VCVRESESVVYTKAKLKVEGNGFSLSLSLSPSYPTFSLLLMLICWISVKKKNDVVSSVIMGTKLQNQFSHISTYYYC